MSDVSEQAKKTCKEKLFGIMAIPLNEEFMKILEFLKGKKTYIVAFLMFVLGLLQADERMILEAVGLFSLRNAIQ